MDKSTYKTVQLVLGLSSILWFVVWLNAIVNNINESVSVVFLHYSFYLFVGSLAGFFILNLIQWKESIDMSEDIIYEIVVYRKMTPIMALSRKLGINKDDVYEIIQNMIYNTKLIGEIRDDIFYSSSPRTPVCPLCGEDIEESIRLIVCPFCRKPFHKDHLLSYINTTAEKCPNCSRRLSLSDLYLD